LKEDAFSGTTVDSALPLNKTSIILKWFRIKSSDQELKGQVRYRYRSLLGIWIRIPNLELGSPSRS
jgi:hypothetical protein